MEKYTQREARQDIRNGFATDGEALYKFLGCAKFSEAIAGRDVIAVGHGVNGINCGLIRTAGGKYIAFKERSSALYCAI